jgi:hypothetical protein
MFIKILIGIAAVVALFLIYVALKPSEFRIERSVKIKAKPEAIFPHVNDAHLFFAWNPWVKPDPNLKQTYSGPQAGVGAVSAWEGNKDVGSGSMTVMESTPSSLVRIQLDFLTPFKGTNTADFTFQPQGEETLVTWAMYGKSSFIPRIFCSLMFMDMDKMIGGTFEKGLQDLKATVESERK